MAKLEKILGVLALVFTLTAFTGVGLDNRAIIHERDRTIERGLFYGGAMGVVVSILSASCSYDRNNRKKENPNRNYRRTNK